MNSHILLNWNFSNHGCNFSFSFLFSPSPSRSPFPLSLSFLERHLLSSSLHLQGFFLNTLRIIEAQLENIKYIMSPETLRYAQKNQQLSNKMFVFNTFIVLIISALTQQIINYNNDKMGLDRHKHVCSHDPFPVSLRPRVDRIGYR